MRELYEILPFEKNLLEKRLPELTSEEISQRLEFQRGTMRTISIAAIGAGLGIISIGTLMYLAGSREHDLPAFAAGQGFTAGGGALYYGQRKAIEMIEGARDKLANRPDEQNPSTQPEPPQDPEN